MAASMDEFKKRAGDYEQEIAAITFEQLAFNPADRFNPSQRVINTGTSAPANKLVGKILRRQVDKHQSETSDGSDKKT